MEMDIDEPGDTMVIRHAIGFAALMGMGLLAEIDVLWTNVHVLLLYNYIKELMTLVLVAHFLYKGTGIVGGVEEVSTGDQSLDGEKLLTLGGGESSGATIGGDGSQGWSSQGSG